MPPEKTSLKLVLKVGGAPSTPEVVIDSLTDDNFSDTDRKQRHKKKKHRHDKHAHRHHDFKKELKKQDGDTEDGDDSEEDLEPTPKRPALDEEAAAEEGDQLHRNLREKRNNDDDKTPLQLCLDYLLKMLQRKDANGFFAFPVTDNIAPGYSSIISCPMDFSTMKTKINSAEYRNVAEFKIDYELMMNNCMAYNHPDTVYHREAKRLLTSGLKHMSKEKLIHMKRGLTFMADITKEELGIEDGDAVAEDALNSSESNEMKKTIKIKQLKMSLGIVEAIPDNLTAEEILEQAESASLAAANKLALRVPNSKIGFLRRKDDGTTTLNILNPDDDGMVSEKEKVVNLGSLVGKLTSGSGSLLGFKEDKRNKVNPVNYLSYGAFSSYAPVYDSSSANISKEDSDLLLSTYADETGLQYSKSLHHFVADAGDYTISMVDDLLNVLTSGQHSKVMALLQQKENEKQENQVGTQEDDSVNLDGENRQKDGKILNGIDDLGTDMSFLQNSAAGQTQMEEEEEETETQKKLNQTSELILDLHRTQYERLSEKLPEHLAYVKDPSEEEIELAHKVTTELTELVKQVTPSDVISLKSVRSAMGIELIPNDDDEEPAEDVVAEMSPWQQSSHSPMKEEDQDNDVIAAASQEPEVEEENVNIFEEGTTEQEVQDEEEVVVYEEIIDEELNTLKADDQTDDAVIDDSLEDL